MLLLNREGVILLEAVRFYALSHGVALFPQGDSLNEEGMVTERWMAALEQSARDYQENDDPMGSTLPEFRLDDDGGSVFHQTRFSLVSVNKQGWKAEFSHNGRVAFSAEKSAEKVEEVRILFCPDVLKGLLRTKEDSMPDYHNIRSGWEPNYYISHQRSAAYARWFNIVLRFVGREDILWQVKEIFHLITEKVCPDYLDEVMRSFERTLREFKERFDSNLT